MEIKQLSNRFLMISTISIVGFCLQFVAGKDQSKNLAQKAFVKLSLNGSKIESVNGIDLFYTGHAGVKITLRRGLLNKYFI